MTSNDDFGALRELVHHPGRGAWRTIIGMVERWDRQELTARVLPYLDQHLDSWPHHLCVAPRRWYLDQLSGNPRPELTLARSLNLLPLAPVTEGRWRNRTGFSQELIDLLAAEQLGKVRELNLSGISLKQDKALCKPLIDTLVSSPALEQLEVLKLSGTGLQAQDIRRLGQAPWAPGLRELNLSTQRLGGDVGYSRRFADYVDAPEDTPGQGGEAIVSGDWRALRTLKLVGSELVDEDLQAMAGWEGFQHLETLHLGNLPTTEAGLEPFWNTETFPALRDLNHSSDSGWWDYDGGVVGEGSFAALADSGLLAQLEHFKINSYLFPDDTWLARLGKELGSPRTLHLAHNSLNDRPLRTFIDSGKLATVSDLDLRCGWSDSYDSATLRRLVEHPSMAGTARLRVYSSQLDDDAMLAIAESPHCADLQFLRISSYRLPEGVTTAGLRAVAESPLLSARVRGEFTRLLEYGELG